MNPSVARIHSSIGRGVAALKLGAAGSIPPETDHCQETDLSTANPVSASPENKKSIMVRDGSSPRDGLVRGQGQLPPAA